MATGADGIRVATPLRMLFGLAAQFNQHRFERAAEDVWHKGLVTPDDAGDYLELIRRSGRTGVRRMDTWLEKTPAMARPAQSGLELDFVALIEQAGLPAPERQHPLVLAVRRGRSTSTSPGRTSASPSSPATPWWHGGDLGQRRDQARDRACSAVGWLVVRFDEDARRDPVDLPASSSPSTAAGGRMSSPELNSRQARAAAAQNANGAPAARVGGTVRR